MASSADLQIILELVVRSAHPALLEGLDIWLRLELLSDETVRQICAENLVCEIRQPVAVSAQSENDFLSELTPEMEGRSIALTASEASPTPHPTGWLAQIAQSFMAELSVVWLLFLGVFMVVVSSGVLAASQWQNVSPVGQYAILLAYTLAFWLVSFLTGKRSNLRLTSRMLQIATLLLIPVNFWMMDSFHLSRSVSGFGLATIAALLLTTIIFLLLKPTPTEAGNTRLILGTAIALSWLHWGWGGSGFPVIATYLGTVTASLALAAQDRRRGTGARGRGAGDGGGEGDEGDERDGGAESPYPVPRTSYPTPHTSHSTPHPLSSGFIAVAFSTLLLIGRAVFVAHVPITRLGLAAGICGWLLGWLSRRQVARGIWAQVGTGLLLAGWLVAVTVTPPWQAVAISGLSLWLLADYLRRSGQGQYLTAGFLVGLQAVWLLWRVIPPNWQQRLLNICIQLAGPTAMPAALAGLWFFPYLLLIVVLAFRLRRWQRPDLAKQAEFLALGLGIVLLAVGSGNSLVRSLTLILSTLTLTSVVLSRRTRPEVPLIYLTHATGLAAIVAWIHQIFPNLSLNNWASIFLAGMLAEWSFSTLAGGKGQEVGEVEEVITPPSPPLSPYSPPSPSSSPSPTPSSLTPHSSPLTPHAPPLLWHQSAWYFGFALAILSYMLLLGETWLGNHAWGGRWLVTPITLTLLGYHRDFWQRRLASWLSVVALFLVQNLTLSTPAERLISLGMATLLMLLNTHQLKHLFAAWITVWFGLGFAGVTIWEILAEKLTIDWAVNLPAIATLLLWLLWSWLKRQETLLAQLYKQATDSWAIILTSFPLLFLTLCNLVVYLALDAPRWQYVLAAAILLIATSFRTWQASLITGFYGLAWSLELLVVGILALNGRSLDQLAIANLALGLATQILGDWWLVRQTRRQGAGGRGQGNSIQNSKFKIQNSPPPSSSYHLIPLLYAGLGLFLAHHSFTAATGLYTLAAAVVGIDIGRRRSDFKPVTYLAVFGVSFGAYELLLYQLAQMKEGSAGDAIALLAALAAFLAIATRLLLPWLVPYLRLLPPEIQAIAHVHWAIGNVFLLGARLNPLSTQGEWAWIGIAVVFAGYALAMGNRRWAMGDGRWAMGDGQRTERFSATSSSPPPPPHPTPDPRPPLPTWTYIGITETTLAFAYLLRLLLPDAFLVDWAGTIAVVYSVVLYLVPWQTWGWYREPWRRSAILLPMLAVLLTATGITLQGLLIVAAFYAWLATSERQVRLSYISVLLTDWAAVSFLHSHNSDEPLWFALLLSASLLYITQLDPGLRSPTERDKRYLLRCLATGLVCLIAFYQSEVGIAGILPILVSMISIGLALSFILTGIWLRVRAFLYIGTLAFMIQILRQLWLFINDYSLLLWAVIGAIGLIFMWIAATFEARRTQMAALVQYWSSELEDWE